MSFSIQFPSGAVNYSFFEDTKGVKQKLPESRNIFITDEHIFPLYPDFFKESETIVIPAGENSKCLQVLETVVQRLIGLEADRKTTLTGVGGGVVTDFTGFVASIYMRGIPFGFVPSSLLAMVDAAIGGKNGINLGLYKNMLGIIRQPGFIFINPEFLNSLPESEWSNGFAEIIKYGCILDETLFGFLEGKDLTFFRKNPLEIENIIQTCVKWKNKIVLEDEKENGVRKLLNFGHTIGHALEKGYGLSHGFAISIGMVIASEISERLCGMNPQHTARLKKILKQYLLPVSFKFHPDEVMQVLRKDKKRSGEKIDFIVLEKPGRAKVYPLEWSFIRAVLGEFSA